MKLLLLLVASSLLATPSLSQKQKPVLSANKTSVIQSVEQQQQELISISDRIWALAETALREHQSSSVLAAYAEAQGFRVKRGVAGMPTAFIA
jgi:aminobenzoyl-glutamate utilization protein B